MEILAVDLPNPYGHSPLRRPNSLRRTTTMDVVWPEGRYGKLRLIGAGRDILTRDSSTQPQVLAYHTLEAMVTADKSIEAIDCEPKLLELSALIGAPCIGGFRKACQALKGHAMLHGTPLALLLDDVVGSTVVSDWAWSTRPEIISQAEKAKRNARLKEMSGVCTGFRLGSSALNTEGDFQYDRCALVPVLPHPNDPAGWHELKDYADVTLRRSRCLDVWLEQSIVVEAMFQDSALRPDGQRVAVHEYSLRAEINASDFTLQRLLVTPHILPHPECPSAMIFVQELVGLPLPEFKERVLSLFRRERGCTHLNDALRALSDLPEMASKLMRP